MLGCHESLGAPSFKNETYSVSERFNLKDLEPCVQDLVLMERRIPVSLDVNKSLRAKITDRCGMACIFCHNEGTPVYDAYYGDISRPKEPGNCERVSIFENSNGANFLPGQMQADDNYRCTLLLLKETIGCNELHLTGGEPTLHKQLPELIKVAKSCGYSVKVTSNGENGAAIMEKCVEAGLDKVNFSIFGTTPDELAMVQSGKYNDRSLAEIKLKSLDQSIDTALSFGIKIDANIVMPDITHSDRIVRIMEKYDKSVNVRILNDLGHGDQSYIDIYKFLASLNAAPEQLYIEAGSSISRVKYSLPDGRKLYFKQIRRTTLPTVCETCGFNNDSDCKEGYYGARLYIDDMDNYKIGVCIQRMDLTENVDNFILSGRADEIVKFRDLEYNSLLDHYYNRIGAAR